MIPIKASGSYSTLPPSTNRNLRNAAVIYLKISDVVTESVERKLSMWKVTSSRDLQKQMAGLWIQEPPQRSALWIWIPPQTKGRLTHKEISTTKGRFRDTDIHTKK